MFRLRKQKLAAKLPLMIAIPTLVVVMTMGAIQTWNIARSLEKDHRTAYSSFVHERTATTERWLGAIHSDLLALADSYAITTALSDFSSAWEAYDGNISADIRKHYITDNPHPLGKKDELIAATDESEWTEVHGRHHVGLRSYQRARGYYDLFLFDMDGNLIYSVFKEDDFALNFISGVYKDSGLGEVFQAGRNLTSGEIHMTDIAPYGPSAGAPAMFMSTPVLLRGRKIGVVAVQVPLDAMGNILSSAEILGATGEVYMVDNQRQVLTNSRAEDLFSTLDVLPEREQIVAAMSERSRYFRRASGLNGETVVAMTDSVTTPRGDTWGLVFEMDRNEAMKIVNDTIFAAVVQMLVTAVLLCLLAWFAVRGVTKRIERLTGAMEEIAEQNYENDIPDQDNGDEIGFIARTLANLQIRLKEGASAQARETVIQENNAKVVQSLSRALMDLAKGDFRNRVMEHFPEEHKKLRYSINDAMNGLNEVILVVRDTAHGINRSAQEISSSADELSSRTEGQAATLEQTAAALEEVTSSVNSANENVKGVESTVEAARQKAEDSSEVVEATVKAMTEIESSSEKIRHIISVIDDIAFQTNLLALNAGVEAARAGDAGRGFAVVASEVRGLAQRSSDAALEIKSLIETSSEQVGRGVELVGRTGEALNTIVDQVKQISGLIGEISQSSQEQSTALTEINTGMSQLDQVTQSNAAMVEENTAAAHMMRSDAEKLTKYVGHFQTQDIAKTAQVQANAPALRASTDKNFCDEFYR